MAIRDRMSKANKVAEAESTRLIFENLVKSNHHLASYTISLNSVNDGSPYQVGLYWRKNQAGKVYLDTWIYSYKAKECQQTKEGHWLHKSHFLKNTLPYQILGAVKWLLQSKGKEVSFCESYESAVVVSQLKKGLNPQISYVTNGGGAVVYFVMNDKPEKPEVRKENMTARVNLMRGSEAEQYID